MLRQPHRTRYGRDHVDKIVFLTLILFYDNNLFSSSEWDFPSNLLRCWYAIWQNQSRVLATFDNFFPLKSQSYMVEESLTTQRVWSATVLRNSVYKLYLSLRPRPLVDLKTGMVVSGGGSGDGSGGGSSSGGGIDGGQYVTCILVCCNGWLWMYNQGEWRQIEKTTNPATGRRQSNWRVE